MSRLRIIVLLLVAAACSPTHPVYCTPDETMCHGSCSALYKDPDNCGACDVACTHALVCSSGTCATSCGGGTTQCGQACVDILSDRSNCGTCGIACKPGEVCSQGSCESTCPQWQKLCGPYDALFCASTQSDNKNCGTCGASCGLKEACVNGACVLTCSQTQTLCGSDCTDVKIDPLHCGDCGTGCKAGEICVAGACTCPSGESICGSTCVQLQTDTANCGGCGKKCLAGTCASGRCTTQIAATLTPAGPIALDAADVYWSEVSGVLSQAYKSSGFVMNLSTTAVTTSIASDGTYVYWANGTDIGLISISDYTTSTQPVGVGATEVVADSSWVYVAHADGIVRFPAGGGVASAIVTGEKPHALTLHGGALSWANDSDQVRHASGDGSGLVTLATMTSAIGDVASDGTNVYFTWASSEVLAVPIASSSPPLLLASGKTGLGQIATDGVSVYWIDGLGISKVPIGGGATTLLHVAGGDAAANLAVDNSSVFWTSSLAVTKLSPK